MKLAFALPYSKLWRACPSTFNGEAWMLEMNEVGYDMTWVG
jgi:hypothetical protein